MDLYEVIGVARNAESDEINKKYRKLAMQYHPDRNPGDINAEIKFKELSNAYDVLNNTEKRKAYDSKIPYHQVKKEPEVKVAHYGTNSAPTQQELSEIECSFFGNQSAGRNIQAQVKVNKNLLKSGGHAYVKIKKRELCLTCIGDGTHQRNCSACGGRGKKSQLIHSEFGYGNYFPPCNICEGTGIMSYPCKTCSGSGVKNWAIKEVRIPIPANSKTGEQITVQGEGEHCPNKIPGYLRVVLIEE